MKLLNILSKLDSYLLKKAELFFASPYFVQNPILSSSFVRICALIKKGKRPTKQQIWSFMYPDQDYNDGMLRKNVHVILKHFEEFIAVEELKNSEHTQLNLKSKFSYDHKLSEFKSELEKQLKKYVFESDITSSESYYQLFAAKRHIIDIEDDFDRKKGYQNKAEFIESISILSNLLNSSHYIEKTRLYLLQNNYKYLTDENIEVITPPSHSSYNSDDQITNDSVLNTYRSIYEIMILKKESFDIDAIVKQLDQILQNNKKGAFEIYQHLGNFLAIELNDGKDYFNEQFLLLKFGIESRLLFSNGLLNPSEYRNLVLAACRLGKYQWALHFVEEYKSYLSIKYRQSAYSFSKARIHWYSKDFEMVIKTLQNVEYEDVTYNLNSKLMLMCSLYELDEVEVLYSTIKAFKVFLRRRRNISKARKDNFTSFCDVLYQLVKAEERKDSKRLLKAKEYVEDNSSLLSRWWLQEKISEVSKILRIKEDTTLSP